MVGGLGGCKKAFCKKNIMIDKVKIKTPLEMVNLLRISGSSAVRDGQILNMKV